MIENAPLSFRNIAEKLSKKLRELEKEFFDRDQNIDLELNPEQQRIRDRFLPYFHAFLIHTREEYDKDSPSHPDQMKKRGQGYRETRLSLGLKREHVAKRMNDDPTRLAAFEGGLIPPNQVPHYFIWELERVLLEEKIIRAQEDLESNHTI